MRYLAALLLIVTLPAHADLYKCKGAEGKTTYQDTPCGEAGEAARIHQPSVRSEDVEAAEARARREVESANPKPPPKRLPTPDEVAYARRVDAAQAQYFECMKRRTMLKNEQTLYDLALRRRADAADASIQRMQELASGQPARCESLLLPIPKPQ
jgi:uncharacterized protein DUF4124